MTDSYRHDLSHEEVVNGIVYRVAKTKEDEQKIVDFYFDFMMNDEPIAKACNGMGLALRPKSIVDQVEDVVRDGVSIIAIDQETGALAGMRTSITYTRSNCPQTRDRLDYLLAKYPVDYARLMWVLDEVAWPLDVFNLHPEDNKIYDMFALCVHPSFRGRGIAKQLVVQAFKVARKANCNSVVVAASSNATRSIFGKMGMDTFNSVDIERIEVNGQRLFSGSGMEGLTAHYIKL